jgi:hypothetical protein
MDSKNWIAVGATSALSLGVVAGGAVSVANAMPLIENATGLAVPGVGTVTDDVDRIDLDFRVQSDSITSPASTNSPASLTSANTPASIDSPASPASVDSPASPASIDSAASPVSVDSPASPASIASPASADSVD